MATSRLSSRQTNVNSLKMEITPLFNAKSNNQQKRDETSTSSYGTTAPCPSGHFDNDFPLLYTRKHAVQALGSAQYAFAPTTLELAEIELQAIRIANRRSRQHYGVRRPRRSYDLEAAEERDMEAELQGWKRACLSLIAFYVVLFGSTWGLWALRDWAS